MNWATSTRRSVKSRLRVSRDVVLGLAGRGALPDALIIGAMKCGTTSLSNYLSQHPQVGAATTKEIHYFDRRLIRGPNWYRAQFRAEPGQISIDATPYYFFHPLVPQRAAALLPAAKLIVLMREPVGRAYSHYHHIRAEGREPLSFEDAIAAEAERLGDAEEALASGRMSLNDDHRRYAYFGRGLYARQIESWLQHYPADRFLFLRSEDLYAAPQEIFERVCNFLAIPSIPLIDRVGRNRRSYEPIGEDIRAKLTERYRVPNQQLEALTGIKWP